MSRKFLQIVVFIAAIAVSFASVLPDGDAEVEYLEQIESRRRDVSHLPPVANAPSSGAGVGPRISTIHEVYVPPPREIWVQFSCSNVGQQSFVQAGRRDGLVPANAYVLEGDKKNFVILAVNKFNSNNGATAKVQHLKDENNGGQNSAGLQNFIGSFLQQQGAILQQQGANLQNKAGNSLNQVNDVAGLQPPSLPPRQPQRDEDPHKLKEILATVLKDLEQTGFKPSSPGQSVKPSGGPQVYYLDGAPKPQRPGLYLAPNRA